MNIQYENPEWIPVYDSKLEGPRPGWRDDPEKLTRFRVNRLQIGKSVSFDNGLTLMREACDAGVGATYVTLYRAVSREHVSADAVVTYIVLTLMGNEEAEAWKVANPRRRKNAQQVKGEQRQAETLAFIKAFVDEHGHAPTMNEIANAIGLSGPGALVHVKALAQAGAIAFAPRKRRGITLIEQQRLDAAA